MDTQSIEAIVRYALLIASREDDFYRRELGPIHFIKYVYLADMEYARCNGGKTFTGVRWTFYRFGPWSQEIHSRIDPALDVLGVSRARYQSAIYGADDYSRWHVDDEDAMSSSVSAIKLPLTITASIQKYVHKFGNDTSALLHFVYATPPILAAAPGEVLDFTTMTKGPQKVERGADVFSPLLDRLPTPKKEMLASRMKELRQSFGERLKMKEAQAVVCYRPDYDTVYDEGVRWLDSLGGPVFPEGNVSVTIADAVWKSETRRGE